MITKIIKAELFDQTGKVKNSSRLCEKPAKGIDFLFSFDFKAWDEPEKIGNRKGPGSREWPEQQPAGGNGKRIRKT